MNICVCIDDDKGMSFFGKRQSRDKKLIERLLSHTEYNKIYVSEYSLPLFSDYNDDRITLTCDFPCDEEDSICFFELEHILEYDKDIHTLIIYKWNRRYPSDKKFPYLPENKGYALTSTVDFEGNSHELITEEVWKR